MTADGVVPGSYTSHSIHYVQCVQGDNIVTLATVVHHTTPHRGDPDVFWNMSLWMPLCARHHDSDAQSVEKGGQPKPKIGIDGWPIDE